MATPTRLGRRKARARILEVDLGGKKSVACIQVLGGWNNKGEWMSYPPFYKLEYFADGKWHTLAETKPDAPDVDLRADFTPTALSGMKGSSSSTLTAGKSAGLSTTLSTTPPPCS